jgi:flagellar hook-length control protein FliK
MLRSATDVPELEASIGQDNIEIGAQSAPAPAGTPALEGELPQVVSAVPADAGTSRLRGANSEVGVILAQTPSQPEAPVPTAALDMPGSLPVQSETGPEKLALEPNEVESQAGDENPGTAVSQAGDGLMSETGTVTTAEANLETGDQSAILVETGGQSRPLSGNKLEPATDGAPLPVPPAGSTAAPSSARSNVSMKVEAADEDLSAVQTAPTGGKPLALEGRPEPAPIPGTVPVARGPAGGDVAAAPAGQNLIARVNTQAAEVVRQIISRIDLRPQSRPASLHLQLNPRELGAIDIEMVSNLQGVSVTFVAEHASTGRLLETQLDQLRQSLVESGVQLSGLNINQHGQPGPGREGGFLNQHPGFAQHPQRAAVSGETAAPQTVRAGRVNGKSSEVDYLI